LKPRSSIAVLLSAAGVVTANAQLVRGTIVDSASRRPLSGAAVTVVGEPALARSDSAGRFVLPLHRGGTVVLSVRRLGYATQTWSFPMTTADTADATLPIAPVVAQLDTVDVNAATSVAVSANVADFERRRRQKNGGVFITREQIDAEHPVMTADLLRRVASVDVRQKDMRTVIVSHRGTASVLTTPDLCVIPLGRDGLILGPTYNVNDIPANEIYGIEVYSGPATVPVQFRNSLPNGFCGLVMVWTRGGATEFKRSP
jgi:hypothetical protein